MRIKKEFLDLIFVSNKFKGVKAYDFLNILINQRLSTLFQYLEYLKN